MTAQLVLVAGPGGSGTSTAAAALAEGAAQQGHRVGLIALDQVTGAASYLPAQPHPNLHVLPPHHDAIAAGLARQLVDAVGLDPHLVDEVAQLPGRDLVGALLAVAEHAPSTDLLVVDAGSQAVELCALADRMAWLSARALPAQRGWLATARPLVATALGRYWPGAQVGEQVGALHRQAQTVRVLVESARAVLVLAPEERRVRPVQVGLALHGIDVRSRLLPTGQEPSTPADLARAADGSFAVDSGLEQLAAEPVQAGPTLAQDGEDWVWRTPLAGVAADEVGLRRRGDDLIVEVLGVRRVASLPTVLRRCHARAAVVRDQALEVRFVPDPQEHRS